MQNETQMTNTQFPESERRRRRVQFVMLALLFMAPVIAAWVAWNYVGDHGVGATSNNGDLVVPARPLELLDLRDFDGNPLNDDAIKGRWTYVMFAPTGCGEHCLAQAYDTRQVRTSVSKDMLRVQRLLVVGGDVSADLLATLDAEHPDLRVARSGGQARAFAQQFLSGAHGPDGAGYFLIDPQGNLMMAYGPDVPASGVLRDLRKLLKISQVG